MHHFFYLFFTYYISSNIWALEKLQKISPTIYLRINSYIWTHFPTDGKCFNVRDNLSRTTPVSPTFPVRSVYDFMRAREGYVCCICWNVERYVLYPGWISCCRHDNRESLYIYEDRTDGKCPKDSRYHRIIKMDARGVVITGWYTLVMLQGTREWNTFFIKKKKKNPWKRFQDTAPRSFINYASVGARCVSSSWFDSTIILLWETRRSGYVS